MSVTKQDIIRTKQLLDKAKKTLGIEHPETIEAWKNYEKTLEEQVKAAYTIRVTKGAF